MALDTDIRGKVAIVGVGHTPQGELPGQSPELNSVLAIKEALKDAGITRDQLDGLITCKSVQGTNTDVMVGPMQLTVPLTTQTFLLTLVMCVLAALVALRRVIAADPAEVF